MSGKTTVASAWTCFRPGARPRAPGFYGLVFFFVLFWSGLFWSVAVACIESKGVREGEGGREREREREREGGRVSGRQKEK